MPRLMRNFLFSLMFFQLIQGVCFAKQVYLRDGSTIDCQSYWRRDGQIFVKVNRDILLNFGSDEVDLAKTFHPASKKAHRKKAASPRTSGAAPVRAGLSTEEPDGGNARKFMASAVKQKLLKGEYGALEEMANRYRSKKERTPNGWWKLSLFYGGFTSKSMSGSEADWNRLFKALNNWEKRYPRSATAKVALATAWLDYAFQARGEKYARDVPPEAWKLFQDRLQKSRKAVAEVTKEAGYPDVLAIRLRLESHLGDSRQAFYDQFNRAVAMEPAYHEFYAEALRVAQPKWGGRPGEWVEVWERVNKIAPKKEAIAARCAGSFFQEEWFRFDNDMRPEPPKPEHGNKALEDLYRIKKNMPRRDPYKNGTLHWDAMKASLKELPDSPFNDNVIAIYACIARDKELGNAQWKKIGSAPSLSAWDNWGIDPVPCRNATDLPKIEGFSDSMEARYMKARLNASGSKR